MWLLLNSCLGQTTRVNGELGGLLELSPPSRARRPPASCTSRAVAVDMSALVQRMLPLLYKTRDETSFGHWILDTQNANSTFRRRSIATRKQRWSRESFLIWDGPTGQFPSAPGSEAWHSVALVQGRRERQRWWPSCPGSRGHGRRR
jgi:hypothetical protein